MISYRLRDIKVTYQGEKLDKQIAVQVNKGMISLDQIATEIAEDTSLGVGDVKSALTHLQIIIGRYLPMGYSIDLGDVGTLSPRIKSKSIPMGEEYKASYIKSLNARFLPSRTLKDKLNRAGFQRWQDFTTEVQPKPENNSGNGTPNNPVTPPSNGGTSEPDAGGENI